MLDGWHQIDEPIQAVMKPLAGVVTLRTPVSRLKELFASDHVALVKEGDVLCAILTKIDLIDWLGGGALSRALLKSSGDSVT